MRTACVSELLRRPVDPGRLSVENYAKENFRKAISTGHKPQALTIWLMPLTIQLVKAVPVGVISYRFRVAEYSSLVLLWLLTDAPY